LNRRPPGYQPGAPAKLSYGPRRQENCPHLSLSGQITEVDIRRPFEGNPERGSKSSLTD
jgi:hypothetical protein